MADQLIYDALPDYAVSPGDYISEWLDDHGVKAAELARRLDVTPKHVSELLSAKAAVSPTVALGLERVTGIPAKFWNETEAFYRSELARLAENKKLAAQYDLARRFPLPYLRTWKYIKAPVRDTAGTVRELLEIFRIASLSAFDASWAHSKVAYRKAALMNDKTYERATWLALGEKAANIDDLPEFDKEGLKALIPQIRALTTQPDPVAAVGEVEEWLRGVGVALCLIPPIPGFGVYGATRWINGHPVVQLSVRGKTDDQLWFTLFHELGHVLLHGQKSVFMQGKGISEGAASKDEIEADDYASRTLIPMEYRAKLPTSRNIAAVRQLASELGIAPSIVLGQAQHLTKDYGWGHNLKITLEWDNGENEE